LVAPPGITYPHSPSLSLYDPVRPTLITAVDKQPSGGSNYTGSFNPFADAIDDPPSSSPRNYSPLDDDSIRKVSRFGFAQGRRGSTAASSPRHSSSPLAGGDGQPSFYMSGEYLQTTAQPQWIPSARQPISEYGHPAPGSPLPQYVQAAQVQPGYAQQHARFQLFESGVSEAQLRDLLQSSRDRSLSMSNGPPGRSLLYM
jgi:CCR4-NOT transcription complex subunit 4